MKRIYPFIFSIFFTASLSAQFRLMEEGKDALLVNYKGDTIWGKAEMDLEHKWVQIKGEQGFRLIEFPKINSLRLYDTDENNIIAYRRYEKDTQRSELLEQVVIGSIHFLRKTQPRTYSNYTGSPMLNTVNAVVENQYYMWYNGKLMKVKNFKKQLFSLASEAEAELLSSFRKENKLQYHKEYDQAVLIDFYNTLQAKQQLATNY